MPRYVAFLRAINVGGHVVKMDRLRTLFEALDFTDVATFIASGNVVFTSTSRTPAALEQRIESHLASTLGYAVETFLRTPAELATIAAYAPFGLPDPTEAGHGLWVGFLRAPLEDAAREQLLALRTDTDEFHTLEREAYWMCRVRFPDSPVKVSRLNKALGTTTMRNVTTVRALAAKYG